MASGKGSTTVDFGAAPGSGNVDVIITGVTDIGEDAMAEAFVMLDATADHSADEHAIAPIKLTCGDVVAGVGFTIRAVSAWRLTGAFNVRYVWSD